MATYQDFARALLSSPLIEGAQVTGNVDVIVARAVAESTEALNNPLATTLGWVGATDFNEVGVKNYPTFEEGVAATAATLAEDRYAAVRGLLKRGDSPQQLWQAWNTSGWGTDPLTLPEIETNRVEFYSRLVPGSDAPDPTPAPTPEPNPTPAPPAPPATYCTPSLPELRQGQKGYPVRILQMILGGGLAVDGIFGPQTLSHVESFQTSKGLSPDGIVGVQTWENLIGRQI